MGLINLLKNAIDAVKDVEKPKIHVDCSSELFGCFLSESWSVVGVVFCDGKINKHEKTNCCLLYDRNLCLLGTIMYPVLGAQSEDLNTPLELTGSPVGLLTKMVRFSLRHSNYLILMTRYLVIRSILTCNFRNLTLILFFVYRNRLCCPLLAGVYVLLCGLTPAFPWMPPHARWTSHEVVQKYFVIDQGGSASYTPLWT